MSEPDFLSLLEGHVGGLVRLRAGLKSPEGHAKWDGTVCLLLGVKSDPSDPGALIELFVDGRVRRLWLIEDEIELIGGDDV